jgi:hypothetical protein
MAALFPTRTISVGIDCHPRDVYDFASTPENLPKWAHGLATSGAREGDLWVAETAQGRVVIRFTEPNDLGVLDHYVSVNQAAEIYNPMRVVANGAGSEVSFTLFRRPEMSDANFAADAGQVEQDLQTLKALLES